MFSITDSEFKKLAEYIKLNYGIHLKKEKQSLLAGRLAHVLQKKQMGSFSEYYDFLLADKTGAAASMLVDHITTNYTFFMRETDHFEYFRDHVLPYLAATVRDKDLRIWSAGCSSGEEPYTLAMILSDFFGKDKKGWDTKVLATDISSQALEKAKNGVYADEQLQTLPRHWKTQHFYKHDAEHSAISSSIKNEVIFRKLNLMDKAFPFRRKFHVIFCRNVMIYFDNPTKNELVNKFYEMTEPGGYLFIGHSESLDRGQSKYNYVMPAVYRKE